MRHLGLCVLACVLTAAGCAAPPDARLAQADPALANCIYAMGGLKLWETCPPLTATAVVTMYDPSGTASINQQRQVIDLGRGTLAAAATVPEGQWEATLSLGGPALFDAKGYQAPDDARKQTISALRTILHRLRGPLNLFQGEKASGARRVRLGGMELIRLPATHSPSGVKAYYFDADTCLLKLVTAGADAPGGDGTVTVYSYRLLPNGLAFPTRIVVNRIGQNVLLGDQPVLEVDYQDVRF